MGNYDDFKKKAKEALDTIADVSVEAYKIAEEKARIFAKRARLSAEITREKALIRRLKVEIGNAYYELHKDDPEEAFKQNCDEINSANERIVERRKELEELKKRSNTEGDAEQPEGEAEDAEVEDEVEDAEVEDTDDEPQG